MSEMAVSAEMTKAGREIDLEMAAAWLEPGSLAELAELMSLASRVRESHLGNQVEFCAIVNAKSGRCSEDCAFCAQSARYHTGARSYPLLEVDELVERGRAAAREGAVRFGLVTSGRACPGDRELEVICRAGERLRKEGMILPCASLGLLRPEQARRLAEAGFVRYHHNLEAGPDFFPRICTSHRYQDRVQTILTAREAGMEVCVGGIVGMGETPRQRAQLARAISELEPQSVPLNFLNPIPGTPLAEVERLSPLQALAAVAVFRLFNPRVHLRTCGGRQQVLGRLAPLMYLAGASATMTGDYLTTSGRSPQEDAADVSSLGLELKRLLTEA